MLGGKDLVHATYSTQVKSIQGTAHARYQTFRPKVEMHTAVLSKRAKYEKRGLLLVDRVPPVLLSMRREPRAAACATFRAALVKKGW